jgi:succinyl-CoA synthetase beta subunit
MRFFEYEAREIVKRAGIPVTDFGFATTAQEAHEIAARLGEPVVIKSQVLTGGRMKAGGVQFAATPDEAAAKAEEVLGLQINGHVPRGVLVDTRAQVAKEYYAGVVWDGIRKQPVMLFSDMGGIDIEEVAESHPDHVGRGHFSNILPLSDFEAKQVLVSVGITGSALNRLVPILTRLARLFVQYDMTLAEINPLGQLEDGSFVALDAHMDMENEARPRQQPLLDERGDRVRARRRGGRRDRPPRRRRQRDRVRRRPGPRHRRRRRLAHALRRRSVPRRQAGQLLRDRRQPQRPQGL